MIEDKEHLVMPTTVKVISGLSILFAIITFIIFSLMIGFFTGETGGIIYIYFIFVLITILFIISSIGLLFGKKWAFIIYFILFPVWALFISVGAVFVYFLFGLFYGFVVFYLWWNKHYFGFEKREIEAPIQVKIVSFLSLMLSIILFFYISLMYHGNLHLEKTKIILYPLLTFIFLFTLFIISLNLLDMKKWALVSNPIILLISWYIGVIYIYFIVGSGGTIRVAMKEALRYEGWLVWFFIPFIIGVLIFLYFWHIKRNLE